MAGCGGMLGEAFYENFRQDFDLKCIDIDVMLLIIDTLIMVNNQQYYEGPREDDKPYYYLSDVPTKNIDLKFYKTFNLKRFGIKAYFEVENLLDERTPRRINPYSGRGYNPGEIIGYHLANSPDPNLDPSRFRKPRSVEIGLQVIF